MFPSLQPWQSAVDGATQALMSILLDTPGLDIAIVAVFLLTMTVLAVYGLHRYHLVYLFYRFKDRAAAAPAQRFDDLPPVTVQLPLYNERFVVEDLLDCIAQLDYPSEKLQIQVLDDSTDETTELAANKVRELAARGVPIEFIHRDDRSGYKAGALENGLATATGELIAIFDADFRPHSDYLHRLVHHFTDEGVGMVQARWTYLNRAQSLLTRVQAILLDGHFVFEHGGRFRSGRFFNFNGTAGILRRRAIADAGGWQHDTLTEDTDLSYRAQLAGWRFVYVPEVEVPSELPPDMASFQVQQARWAKGLIQTGIKLLPRIFRATLPLTTKIEAWFHLTANLSYPLMVVLSTLIVPSMLIRFYQWRGQLIYIDLLLFLGSFSSLVSFYVFAQREVRAEKWWKTLLLIPVVLGTGIGLTISNTRAVLEALRGTQTPFHRTAKCSGASAPARRYRLRSAWLTAAHLFVGAYFVACCLYSLLIGNFVSIPFLLLFVIGYFWTGAVMLVQATAKAP